MRTGPEGEQKFSNLEYTVLGLAWLRGPCTIYAIMKELSLSVSSYHKSRAGTAYSVAKRLLQSGYLVSNGTEKSGKVVISELGILALRDWFATPIPFSEVAHTADFIRLRFFFLGVIEREERLAFIDTALESLRMLLVECKQMMGENERIGDDFGVLATASIVIETQGRIRWLKIVRRWVAEPFETLPNWSDRVLEELR